MRVWPRGMLALTAAVLAMPGLLRTQSLVVSPKALKLLQVERGPLGRGSISITSAGPETRAWTATASTTGPNDPWLEISPHEGRTPGTLTVSLVGWRGEQRKPGKYQGSIAIKAGSDTLTVPVEWEVRPSIAPAAFSYISGPNGCNKAEGYSDPPLCIPLPLGDLGGFLPGASYVDPNFGAKVRVMTEAPVFHTYSTPSPLSAHNKYLMTYPENGTWDILDIATGGYILRRAPCNQSFFWDASDDETYYYLDGAAIYKHEMRGNKTTVFIDYAKQPEFQFHEIVRGATGDTSKDNWISFWAPDEKQLCAVDLTHSKTYCGDYSASQRKLVYGDIDFTLISKGVDRQSGKRYVMMIAPPAMGVFSVDLAGSALKPEFRGPEEIEKGGGNHNGICEPGEKCVVGSHLDTLEDSGGIQYLVMNTETSSPCEVALSTFQLNTGSAMNRQVELGGGRKRVMTLWRCGPGWVDEHVACARAAPYCVISTQNVARNPKDLSPFVPTPHAGEIIVMRENGMEVRRLALSRSALFPGAGAANYWSTPRAAISGDGTLVVSDSNFGVEPNGQRVTLIQTGYPK